MISRPWLFQDQLQLLYLLACKGFDIPGATVHMSLWPDKGHPTRAVIQHLPPESDQAGTGSDSLFHTAHTTQVGIEFGCGVLVALVFDKV